MARRRQPPAEAESGDRALVEVYIPERLQFGPQWFHKSTEGLPDSVREGEARRWCEEVQQTYVECKSGQRPSRHWHMLRILYPMSAEELGIGPVEDYAVYMDGK